MHHWTMTLMGPTVRIGLQVTWTILVVALTAAAVNVLWDARDASGSYRSSKAMAVVLAVVVTGSLLSAPRWPTSSAAVAAAGVLGLTFGEYWATSSLGKARGG